MAKNLNDVLAALPPERRAKVEQRAGELATGRCTYPTRPRRESWSRTEHDLAHCAPKRLVALYATALYPGNGRRTRSGCAFSQSLARLARSHRSRASKEARRFY